MNAHGGGLVPYWNMLYGAEPRGALVEVRFRLPERGMGQRFYDVRDEARAFELITKLGRQTDVYLGVAPRRERRGGRDAVERVHALWADCDSPESIAALGRFEPAPAIVVHSGGGRHGYWPLVEPLAPSHVERANRRLAQALGADARSTDAARILRPPETFNHKGGERRQVYLERLVVEVYEARQVVGGLPDPPGSGARVKRGRPHEGKDDVLLTIAPAVYVRALTGAEPGRDGKVPCPFHEDRTPSLHVYPAAERGWTCFGCGRGGTIYDFAAALWSVEPRGEGFRELRRRLAAELLGSEAAA